MAQTISRLLKTYEFFNGALGEHGDRLAPAMQRDLEDQRAQAFLDILLHAAQDVRVTIAQLGFIVSNLDRIATDPAMVPSVQAACARHLRTLADQVQAHMPPPPARLPRIGALDASEFTALHLIRDRAAVFDTSFRYVFSNAANAQFHGIPVDSFIGRQNPDLVGEAYFQNVSRPLFESCFSGQVISFITSHPLSSPTRLFSVTFNPLRGRKDEVIGLLAISRDISDLPVPVELNVAHAFR